MCSVKQHLTRKNSIGVVPHRVPENSGPTRYFPPSKPEGRECSDELGDYKDVLFHVQLIRYSVTPPCGSSGVCVCVGLKMWLFTLANITQ